MRRVRSRACLAAMRALAARTVFSIMASAISGVLSKDEGKLVAAEALDYALDLGVSELALGLSLELGFHHLDRENGGEPLAYVVARESIVELLSELGLLESVVDSLGEGGTEADEVGAALAGVDAVDEGEHRLVEAVVILEPDLDFHVVASSKEVDRIFGEDGLILVEELYKLFETAVELELNGTRGWKVARR